ncbi:MAG: LytTR family transcriptional regulator DNA-binding domain-containing protein [Fluviicola sp.]|nr:LytTR family transcriptional regulator DNA-binding domain-containing protein [Fluviicola sp.]
MFNFLGRPYPFLFSIKKVALASGLIGLFITLIFYFLPVIDSVPTQVLPLSILIRAVSYGVITSISIHLVFGVVTNYFYSESKKENWTISRQFFIISLLLFTITLLNYIFILLISINPKTFFSFDFITHLFIKVIILGLLPTFFLTWVDYTVRLKQNLLQTQEHNQLLSKVISHDKEDNHEMSFSSENKNEPIHFNLNKLLFIKSEGNYVEIYTSNESSVEKNVYRASLSFLEDKLNKFEFVFKTHRSYIVNLHNIKFTKGDARNYQLFFDGLDINVPVSRAKFKEFNEKIKK